MFPPSDPENGYNRFYILGGGEFVKEDREPEAFFKIIDRAAVYDILSYIVTLELSADNTIEITRRYEEFETYLLEKEYGVWELAYPSSLYMRCIQALEYGKKRAFLVLHIRAVVFVLCGNFKKSPRTFI